MGILSVGLIKYLTGEYDLELVRRLSVENQGVKEIDTLKECANLVELSLSGNEVMDLRSLSSLDALVRLNLASNCISKLDGLESLVALEYLDLRDNDISDLDELSKLASVSEAGHIYVPLSTTRMCTKLTTLFMRDYESSKTNPACQHPAYFNKVTRYLPQLEVLDGESLRIREMAEDKLSKFLTALMPDEEARKTPPLEPWFEGLVEEEEQGHEGEGEARGGRRSGRPRRNNSLEADESMLEDTAKVLGQQEEIFGKKSREKDYHTVTPKRSEALMNDSVGEIRKLQSYAEDVLQDTQDMIAKLGLDD